MYVDWLLYANKYYDLIIIVMRFIIFVYLFIFLFCWDYSFSVQKLSISSGNRSIDDPEFQSGYFLLRNLSLKI
jgi:hypothetical protein